MNNKPLADAIRWAENYLADIPDRRNIRSSEHLRTLLAAARAQVDDGVRLDWLATRDCRIFRAPTGQGDNLLVWLELDDDVMDWQWEFARFLSRFGYDVTITVSRRDLESRTVEMRAYQAIMDARAEDKTG